MGRVLIFLLLFLPSCTANNQGSNQSIAEDSFIQSNSKDSVAKKSEKNMSDTIENLSSKVSISNLSCMQLIDSIVSSSNLDKGLKHEKRKVDEIDNAVITIKIYNINELKVEVPICWLELDTKEKELRDVTADPDNPQRLKFDKSLLPLVVKGCLK